MHFQSTRILKEARALFWPWCAVTLAATLSFVPSGYSVGQTLARGIASLGFWLGIPLIATLAFGNEFQYQTFSLILTQPLDRMKIWRDKMLVVFVAVLSSAGVYVLGYRDLITLGGQYAVLPFIWVVVTVGAAVSCTLLARSTVGGMILNFLHVIVIALITFAFDRFLGPEPAPEAVRNAFSIAAAVAIVYGIIMVWIGRLMLARFQATGTANNDLLASSPQAVRAAFSQFLRCSPDSPLSNLIVKEIRLLGPLWLLAILFSLLLLCLAPLQWMPGNSVVQANVPFIAGFIVFLYALLSMLLAGCLSMGDERTLGTQLWHMTLPVSAGLQWLIKLSMAILATFGGLAFVFTVGQLIFGFAFVDRVDDLAGGHTLLHFFALSLLSFPAFWCACAVKGTVRAALWAIPATAATLFVTRLAIAFAEGFGGSALMDFVVSKVHSLRPMSEAALGFFFDLAYGHFGLLWLLIPPTLAALVQSRRLFRREVPENSKSLVRALLWPVGIAFVFSFALQMPWIFARQSWVQGRDVLWTVFTNVEQLSIDLSQTDKTHPRQLSSSEVAAALSPDARRWLGEPGMSAFAESVTIRGTTVPKKKTVLKVHLYDGSDCTATRAIDVIRGKEFPWKFVMCVDPHEDNSRFVRLRRWLHLNME